MALTACVWRLTGMPGTHDRQIQVELDLKYQPPEGATGAWAEEDFGVSIRDRPGEAWLERRAVALGHRLARGVAQQDDEDNELELELEDEPDVELSGVVFSHLKSRARALARGDPSQVSRARDFQVGVTVLQAQKLVGVNINPYVAVRVGEQRRVTATQRGTNCPFYNEYFLFEFHETRLHLQDLLLEITVKRTLPFMASQIGTFRMDLGIIFDRPEPAPAARVPAQRPWARLRVRVDRAEGLRALRPGLLRSPARALQAQRVLMDRYVRVSFLGQQATMIDPALASQPISFEISIGVWPSWTPEGHGFEDGRAGCREEQLGRGSRAGEGAEGVEARPLLEPDVGVGPVEEEELGTPVHRPEPTDGNGPYLCVPLRHRKPCVRVWSRWEDHTGRPQSTNCVRKVAERLDQGLQEVEILQRRPGPGAYARLKQALEELVAGSSYFQLRAHLYQARGVLAADDSRLSDPFARVLISTQCQTTWVLEQTLSPLWDELLVFDQLIIDGRREHLQEEPPLVLVNVLDHSKFGPAVFLGRSLAAPRVKLMEDPYQRPELQFFPLRKGPRAAGELIATFELIELDFSGRLEPSVLSDVEPQDLTPLVEHLSGHLSLPPDVRPVLREFCVEDFPKQPYLQPPLSILVIECRAFGCTVLVSSHIVSHMLQFILRGHEDPPEEEGEEEETGDLVLKGPQGQKSLDPFLAEVGMSRRLLKAPLKKLPLGSLLNQGPELEEDIPDPEELDWWSKYYASLQELQGQTNFEEDEMDDPGQSDGVNLISVDGEAQDQGQGEAEVKGSISQKKAVATLKIYDGILEEEFNHFEDWLNVFPLYRGQGGQDGDGEEEGSGHPVGKFKATNLAPADPNGKVDPYVVVSAGRELRDTKECYIPKQLNPIFGEVLELGVSLPAEPELTVAVFDHDLVGSNDLTGETHFDLENRFYSHHRANCGLASQYDVDEYNAWWDAFRPPQILAGLCQRCGLSGPEYRAGAVKVGSKVFPTPPETLPPGGSGLAGSLELQLPDMPPEDLLQLVCEPAEDLPLPQGAPLLLLALLTVFLLLVGYTMPGQISQVTSRPLHRP
ncbi:hypothetical protein GH733_010176 [Mirounga leonina]|nr:hypothetical protein GH733_010176 [Mirounga leonina]